MGVTIRQVCRAPAAPSRVLVFAITIASLEPGAADETPRVHHAHRRRGNGMAARRARAAAGDAGDRVSQRRLDDHRFPKWKAGSTRNVHNSRQWVTPRTASLWRRRHELAPPP